MIEHNIDHLVQFQVVESFQLVQRYESFQQHSLELLYLWLVLSLACYFFFGLEGLLDFLQLFGL